MELSIFDGTILMVYNLGTEDHDIGQLDVKVNDGKVHSVRFTRTGPNSTLQVDNHNVIRKTPSGGRQLTVFNSHHKLQIGGKMNTVKDYLEKPFAGIISGLLYNGYRLLDLAMETDPRIEIKGDVLLVTSTGRPLHRTPVIPNESSRPEGKGVAVTLSNKEDDAIIFSGEGSGDCFDDDDDDDDGCEIKSVKETDLDGLITPKYVEPAVDHAPPTSGSTETWLTTSTSIPVNLNPCNSVMDSDCLNSPHPSRPSSSSTALPKETVIPTDKPETLFSPTSTTTQQPERPTHGWFQHVNPTNPISHYPILPYHYQTTRPRSLTPTRPTGRLPINEVPRPDVTPTPIVKQPQSNSAQTNYRTKSPQPNVSSVNKTALLIGLIAITLIIIVILTPMLFYAFMRCQNNRYYKKHQRDGSLNGGLDFNRMKFNPLTGAPIPNDLDFDAANHMYHGSSRSNVSHINTPEPVKSSKKKDNREWYV